MVPVKGYIDCKYRWELSGSLITTSVNGCTFSVIVTRGSTPYKYEIESTDNGATWSTSSQPSWTQMPNGNYLIRVTDACNVSRLVSTTVALDPVEYFTQVYYPFNGANRDSFKYLIYMAVRDLIK